MEKRQGIVWVGWEHLSSWEYCQLFCSKEIKKKVYEKYSKKLLTLTWCHCNPADAPTRSCITAISSEHQVDDIASAYDGGRQGGAAAFPHQSCPVAVRDCQMVVATVGIPWIFVNIKSSELQWEDLTLLHLYRLCLLKVVWIAARVVWWGDHTCEKSF